ncbi:hypothetical protein LR013_05290 [candidate division NPL-UPA2 bacterium]|nr:hypothetical protein [candidate division NPL-UPA2 bacterium]
MSARRMLIISLLISLLGHLIIFTTFSVITPGEEERPSELTRVSFLGELVEKRISSRVEAVARENRPRLQPLVREIEVGPDLSLSKPLPTVPAPQISLEGMLSFLGQEEASLLQMRITEERKEVPPKKLHLLEKERDE